jgi:AcrR family transcriptional regulator
MNPQVSVDTQDEVREQILDAADQRFRQYGYNKTTMAEIAGDCHMSAANLYRYFENKLDIGAGLACRCFAEEGELLGQVLEQPGQSASQRLEACVLAALRRQHTMCKDTPRLNEMVEAVATQRRDLVSQRQQAKQKLFISILAEGNAGGEFDVRDLETTAEAIRAAITLFDVPLFAHLYSLEEMERLARNVVGLILRGLLKERR